MLLYQRGQQIDHWRELHLFSCSLKGLGLPLAGPLLGHANMFYCH